jgi:predicted secreted protein
MSAAFCAAFTVSAAHANDAAARRVIGFSPDGRYFAFEQYGVQDWSDNHSGYSEIAIIDAENDTFVGGKPIKIVDESDGGGIDVAEARKRAAAQAAPTIAKYQIASRGEKIAFDPFTFPEENLKRKDIPRVENISEKSASVDVSNQREIVSVDLADVLADSAKDCSGETVQGQPPIPAGKARGFKLTLGGLNNKSIAMLHEDKSVPASRDCPTSYSLSEAYLFQPRGGQTTVAVFVQSFSQGFEGRDRRFVAVTGRLRQSPPGRR